MAATTFKEHSATEQRDVADPQTMQAAQPSMENTYSLAFIVEASQKPLTTLLTERILHQTLSN